MRDKKKIVLLVIMALIGAVCSTILFIPQAEAKCPDNVGTPRCVNVFVLVLNPDATPPAADGTGGCSDLPTVETALNPCHLKIYGKKGMWTGSCRYYSFGDDDPANHNGTTKSTAGNGDVEFYQVTFWPDTLVTPAIFKAYDGDEITGLATFTTQEGEEIHLSIGDPIPEDVIVKDHVPLSGLTGRIVNCITEVLQRISHDQIGILTETFRNINLILVTLAIALYSKDVLLNRPGYRRPSKLFSKTIMICGVIAFTSSVGVNQYINFFRVSQRELAQVVTDATKSTKSSGTFCGRSSKKYAFAPLGSDPTTLPPPDPSDPDANKRHRPYDIWERVDCIIASYTGIRQLTKDGKKIPFDDIAVGPYDPGIKISLMPTVIVMGLLFTPLGPFLLITFVGPVLLMMAAFIQAVIVYLTSLIVVTFLGIIGPIIIPMLLFKSTRQGFSLWVQMLIAYTLQPMILFAFLAFMLVVIDTTLYGSSPPTVEIGAPPHEITFPLSSADIDELAAMLNAGNPAQLAADTGIDVNKITAALTDLGNGVAADKVIPALFEFPVEGSLMWYYEKAAGAAKEAWQKVDVFHLSGNTQDVNRSPSGDSKTATSGNEKSAISWWRYCFFGGNCASATSGPAEYSEAYRFLQTLLAALLLFWLMFSMLVNVMNDGARLAGLEANVKMQALNVYNWTARAVSDQVHGR